MVGAGCIGLYKFAQHIPLPVAWMVKHADCFPANIHHNLAGQGGFAPESLVSSSFFAEEDRDNEWQ